MIKNVLFDLYGTLIDIHTDEESNQFWFRLARKFKKFKSYTPLELKEAYLKQCHLQEKEEIDISIVFEQLFSIDQIKAKNVAVVFRKLSTTYIRCYKEAKGLLKKLKKAGYRLFVLSNAQSAFTLPELKRLKLLSYFDGLAISSDYGIKKPNIDFFRQALVNFDLKEFETCMIGNDYECDILPALKLGLKTIYIESNLSPNQREVEKLKKLDKNKIYELLS
ncbi:MAG: HAD family hydrolase [Anaeroplasmataceae bacterium]|nr:HAD family hydrolase [Anaeroplasmataceae bacterium]